MTRRHPLKTDINHGWSLSRILQSQSYLQDLSELTQEIARLGKTNGCDLEQKKKKRIDKIESLEEKKSGYARQISTYENHIANLATNGEFIKSKLLEKKGELTSMRQKCLDIENDIKQLQNEKTDKLDLFGTDTRRVIKSINESIKKFTPLIMALKLYSYPDCEEYHVRST